MRREGESENPDQGPEILADFPSYCISEVTSLPWAVSKWSLVTGPSMCQLCARHHMASKKKWYETGPLPLLVL